MSSKAPSDRQDPALPRLTREQKTIPTPNVHGRALAQAAAHLAGEKKASDVRILDVEGVCGYADFFVVCSAPSERQSGAIARNVDDSLKKGGAKPLSTEGLRQGNWALIDYGDVVVHIFLDSARDYYDLEGFWTDGKSLPIDEAEGIAALAGLGLSPTGEPLAAPKTDD
jgi:ribosome-associated protein